MTETLERTVSQKEKRKVAIHLNGLPWERNQMMMVAAAIVQE
jgi:radical SAM superfamily enzyme